MDFWGHLLWSVGNNFLSALASPFYWLLVVLIGWQYRRLTKISGEEPVNRGDFLRPTLVSAGAGLVGGFLGSILAVLVGIDLAGMGLVYLFATALLLMLIHPRFLCFAYAGGLVSLAYLFLGFPVINVAQVMALVAILHMVESLLILLTGHLDPIPIYLKREGYGLVGGFNLQKFWPIPLVVVMTRDLPTGTAWWPTRHGLEVLTSLTQNLVPVMAILGYGEITTTSEPRFCSRSSAGYLFLFSLILLLLALIAGPYPDLALLPAIFGPVGHEMVVAIGLKKESRRVPLFTKPQEGIMVLDVIKGSWAEEAGIKSRDIILSVNGRKVDSEKELRECLEDEQLRLLVLRDKRPRFVSSMVRPRQNLGLILTPDPGGYWEDTAPQKNILRRWPWRKRP